MLPLLLGMLLLGSQAQFSNIIGSLSSGFKNPNLGVVNTLTNGVNNGATAVTSLSNSTRQGNVLTDITSGAKKEAGAIVQPVESAAFLTATSQCDLVKKLLGVDYISRSQLKDQDLKQLTLDFISPSLRIIYNLTQAAELIPASRGFNPKLPFIIILHGFLSDTSSESVTTIVDAFHKKGEYNVLALNSNAYIGWFYLRATTYVRYVGERLAEVLAALVQRGLNPSAIHLIGHSLGGHICGFAGKEFTRLTGLRVGRISGLDPAGPCFFNVGSEFKLNATDADYVDVSHTTHGSLGLTEPCGHSDFYPNGGTQQPECVLQTCSHGRAWNLYTESISEPETFVAAKCCSWNQFRANQCEQQKVLMGYGTTPDVRGLFFLETAPTSPFGLGEAGAIYSKSEGLLKSVQPLGPGALFG